MISNTINTNFGKLMEQLNLDTSSIIYSFGPYSHYLTLQKNVLIASGRSAIELSPARHQCRSTFKIRREEERKNILRNTVLVYPNTSTSKLRVQYVFYFYHDTIGSIIEEIFYNNLKDNLKPFEESVFLITAVEEIP